MSKETYVFVEKGTNELFSFINSPSHFNTKEE